MTTLAGLGLLSWFCYGRLQISRGGMRGSWNHRGPAGRVGWNPWIQVPSGYPVEAPMRLRLHVQARATQKQPAALHTALKAGEGRQRAAPGKGRHILPTDQPAGE